MSSCYDPDIPHNGVGLRCVGFSGIRAGLSLVFNISRGGL